MARPRKAPHEKRDEALNPRLTAAERAEIERSAAAFGVSPSEFMRRRALGYRLPADLAAQQATASIGAAFNRLGVNLNQIARHLNAGGGRSAALERDLHALLERINAAMDRLYGPGGNGRGPQL